MLRFFTVETSIQNWHEISKSSKILKSFDVTGFVSKNVDSELTWDIQIMKEILKSFDVTGFLSKNVNSELTWDIQIIKNLDIFRRYGFCK